MNAIPYRVLNNPAFVFFRFVLAPNLAYVKYLTWKRRILLIRFAALHKRKVK